MRELVIKKCKKCNALVKIFEDCNCNDCGIVCCGEKMTELIPNSVDGAVEKHVPQYSIKGDLIEVNVNHVMENDHYIEWIAAVNNEEEYIKYLKPGQDPKAVFKFEKGMILYSYCNKHLLWKAEVK